MKETAQIPVPSKDPADKKDADKTPVHADTGGAPKDDAKAPNDDELVRANVYLLSPPTAACIRLCASLAVSVVAVTMSW